jgi:hypothetical protein
MAVLTTFGLQQSIRQGWPRAWLAYVDHPDGEVWVWSGVGALEYDGATYEGLGRFGNISGVGGEKVLGVRQVTFAVAGIPTEAIKWLNTDVRGAVAGAWIAGLDKDGREVNGSAWPVVDGLADYQELPVGDDGDVVILLHVNDPVFQLERSQSLLWTPEWAKARFGDDVSGLDLISSLADASENWTLT